MHALLDAFETVVRDYSERPAACDQSLRTDYQTFRALACGLAGQVAERTDRQQVGVMAPTSSAMAAAIFAAWYAGKTAVPLNFLLGEREFTHVLADSGIGCVLTVKPMAERFTDTGLDVLVLEGNKTLVPGDRQAPPAAEDDLAVILYTSGTAGLPKGVELTFGNLVANTFGCIEHVGLTREHRFLGVLPQFHCFGLTALTLAPLLLGARVHYLPRFSPVTVLSAIADERISVLMAVPSMFAALARSKTGDAGSGQSLELVISGGEPLPRSVATSFEEKFHKRVLEGYGLTESSPVLTFNRPEGNRPGSVGTCLPDVEVAVVNEQDRRLPPGDVGELIFRGPNIMRGYRNLPDETRKVLRDGWLYTGDIGFVDADGYVHITGRAKDMMIIGGENVFPREIEQVLARHPAVAECAVVGRPHETRGETPVGFVILRDGQRADERELREFCRAQLATYKCPRRIHFKDDLPRGPTGKVLRRELKP